jgi:hypothetical protein
MENTIDKNVLHSENEMEEIHQHSYILRIWKSAEGVLKGYILDPITNQTYPLVNIPVHWEADSDSLVPIPACKDPLIKPFQCHLGVWEPLKE